MIIYYSLIICLVWLLICIITWGLISLSNVFSYILLCVLLSMILLCIVGSHRWIRLIIISLVFKCWVIAGSFIFSAIVSAITTPRNITLIKHTICLISLIQLSCILCSNVSIWMCTVISSRIWSISLILLRQILIIICLVTITYVTDRAIALVIT